VNYRPSTSESTRDLLERARARDREALERLCDRYLPRLRRWAHGRVPRGARRHVDTDDVVQDTFVKTIGRLDGFELRGDGALLAYLRQAVLNRIRDAIRQAARRPAAAEDELAERAEPDPSPLEQVLGREAVARYEAALARLPEAQASAVVARVEMGLPWSEVAAVLDKPSADAARMVVSRALVHLAREMADG
jgi:RNA polymerase sigma-70 factor, ECF subfamily